MFFFFFAIIWVTGLKGKSLMNTVIITICITTGKNYLHVFWPCYNASLFNH